MTEYLIEQFLKEYLKLTDDEVKELMEYYERMEHENMHDEYMKVRRLFRSW